MVGGKLAKNAKANLKPVSARSDATGPSLDEGNPQDADGIAGDQNHSGMTRIEKALAALSKSLDRDAALESVSNPSAPESAAEPLSNPYASALQRLANRLSNLEESKDEETFQREMEALRDQFAAKTDRFEQRVAKGLSSCVTGLAGFSNRLDVIEKNGQKLDQDVGTAIKKLLKKMESETSLTSETREQVASLSAKVESQVSSLQELHDQVSSLHDAVKAGMKALNAKFSEVDKRFQATLDQRFKQAEKAQSEKLSSLDRLIGELTRKSFDESSKLEAVCSQIQSAFSETHQRVANCESDTQKILRIEVEHAEARRDRVKALDATLQDIMSRYNPEADEEVADPENSAEIEGKANQVKNDVTEMSDQGA
jgi:DNA repair exonuclease SbcCD ATPase subunit